MRRYFFLILLAVVFCGFASAHADTINDPQYGVDDPSCNSTGSCPNPVKGDFFVWYADQDGGGSITVTNESGGLWKTLEVVIPGSIDPASITCPTNAFSGGVCSISTLEGQFGVETILFFGSVGCASAPAGCQNSGINNTETMAINAFGWGPQVGFANYMNLDAPTYEAPAPPIPEPASLVMLAGGIGCCITRLRRRK